MSELFAIRIGEVAISVSGDRPEKDWSIPPACGRFLCQAEPDIRLRLGREPLEMPEAEQVFDCPPIWSLLRRNGVSFVRIFADYPGLETTLVLPDHLQEAELLGSGTTNRLPDPFYGPTLELLMMTYLAEDRGAILHACGVAKEGRGLLFVGESGAGKSTMARMWAREEGFAVLSDDRVIVRPKGQGYWMYGTPWHGEAAFAAPLGVRLERIFFLKHGERNSLQESTGIDPLSRFVTCSFLPHWDDRGMAFSLEFLAELAATIPCQELTFTPDRRAIDLVKNLSPACPGPAGLR